MNYKKLQKSFLSFNEFMDIVDEISKEILISKGKDYSNDNNRLKNFKEASVIANIMSGHNSRITETDSILFMIGNKISRIGNLKNKSPENETVLDSWIDLLNYVKLGMWDTYLNSQTKPIFIPCLSQTDKGK